MLTIHNKEKLLGHGFISNGKEWRITNIKESIHNYYITIVHSASLGTNNPNELLKFEIDRDKGKNAGYGMITMDSNNNSVDWNILFADMIKTKTAMICELQLIMNKFYK